MAHRHHNREGNDEGGSLDGTWSPLCSTWEDVPTPIEDLRDVTLTFENGRCEVRRGATLIRRGTYSTDTSSVPHDHRRLFH